MKWLLYFSKIEPPSNLCLWWKWAIFVPFCTQLMQKCGALKTAEGHSGDKHSQQWTKWGSTNKSFSNQQNLEVQKGQIKVIKVSEEWRFENNHVLHVSNGGSKCESQPPRWGSAPISGAFDEKAMKECGSKRTKLYPLHCRSSAPAAQQCRSPPASVAMPPPLSDRSPAICKRATACAFVKISAFLSH